MSEGNQAHVRSNSIYGAEGRGVLKSNVWSISLSALLSVNVTRLIQVEDLVVSVFLLFDYYYYYFFYALSEV